MDFSLNEEQSALVDSLRKLGATLNEGMVERDRAADFDRKAWQRCADIGLQGLPIPGEFGGAGADALTTALGLEAFSRGCRDEGLTFSICAHMQTCSIPLLLCGTEEQKKRYLPGLCDGALIGGNAMSEPGSGSDAYSMTTTAVRDGDYYILNGNKTWVTNGPVADLLLVFAMTNPEYRQFGGISGFLVEKGTPGFNVGREIDKMGLRTSPQAEISLQDCRVPAANLLGEEGAGVMAFSVSMEWERTLLFAATLGRMHDVLDRSIDYAKNRRQFGKPIGRNQEIAHKLVDMKAELEASRLLLYKAAWQKDRGDDAFARN